MEENKQPIHTNFDYILAFISHYVHIVICGACNLPFSFVSLYIFRCLKSLSFLSVFELFVLCLASSFLLAPSLSTDHHPPPSLFPRPVRFLRCVLFCNRFTISFIQRSYNNWTQLCVIAFYDWLRSVFVSSFAFPLHLMPPSLPKFLSSNLSPYNSNFHLIVFIWFCWSMIMPRLWTREMKWNTKYTSKNGISVWLCL